MKDRSLLLCIVSGYLGSPTICYFHNITCVDDTVDTLVKRNVSRNKSLIMYIWQVEIEADKLSDGLAV